MNPPDDCTFIAGRAGGLPVFLVRHRWGGDWWTMYPHYHDDFRPIEGPLAFLATTHFLEEDSLVVHRPDGSKA